MKNRWRYMALITLIVLMVIGAAFVVTKRYERLPRAEINERMDRGNNKVSLSVSVYNEDGTVEQMELEEYITRVVLGEVPVGYHLEALKAQAVAARTYTLYCILSVNKHPGGAVCTDHRCCQAYCEPQHYLDHGGTESGLEKVRRAVEDTRGEVLYYDKQLICATYFACSGGRTEAAEAVWGEKYPYLQTVLSSDENSGCDEQRMEMSPQELEQYLGVQLTGEPEQWFGFKTATVGGGVALMRIGGSLYTGVELRKILNLKSTIFNIEVDKETIIVRTRGYGHRVGLSQHGANAMAVAGNKYTSILLHYYTDVTVRPYVP